jgi:hypothetical protein
MTKIDSKADELSLLPLGDESAAAAVSDACPPSDENSPFGARNLTTRGSSFEMQLTRAPTASELPATDDEAANESGSRGSLWWLLALAACAGAGYLIAIQVMS